MQSMYSYTYTVLVPAINTVNHTSVYPHELQPIQQRLASPFRLTDRPATSSTLQTQTLRPRQALPPAPSSRSL